MLSSKEISMLIEATGTSVYMTLVSTLMAYVIGLPIGILLVVCAPGGLKPKAVLYKILDFIVNITRSIPFLILMLLATPLARLVTGKSYGANATIISLTLDRFYFSEKIGQKVHNSYSVAYGLLVIFTLLLVIQYAGILKIDLIMQEGTKMIWALTPALSLLWKTKFIAFREWDQR